jgi:hypothetical protein
MLQDDSFLDADPSSFLYSFVTGGHARSVNNRAQRYTIFLYQRNFFPANPSCCPKNTQPLPFLTSTNGIEPQYAALFFVITELFADSF